MPSLILGVFLAKTGLVLVSLAKEGADCMGVFGKESYPFLRGLI